MDEISNDLKALWEPINKDRLGYTTNPKAVKLRCEYDKSKTRIQEINENRKIIDVVVFYWC
jgi:hypothetical protein